MSFLNPVILWGLLAIIIPVVIHLFNFRRIRKVYFSNVSFLKEVSEKNRKRAELKHLLVLFSRILAITAMVLAFAGPMWKSKDKGPELSGERIVSVYLDNSFSMQSGAEFEANLKEAKEKIRRITATLPPATRYQLISNDLEPGAAILLSRDDLIRNVDQKQVSSSSQSMSGMIDRMQSMMPEKEKDKSIFLLVSDFQSLVDEEPGTDLGDSLGQYIFIPVGTKTEVPNLFIERAWLEAPVRQAGTSNRIKVSIVNATGDMLEKVSLRFFINNVQQSATAIDIEDDGTVEVELPFKIKETGVIHARIELTDYPVSFDDTWYLSWFADEQVDILQVYPGSGNTGYLPRLFSGDSVFSMMSQSETNIDYSRFPEYGMIILDGIDKVSAGMGQELDKALQRGANVLVFPPSNGLLDPLNDWLAPKAARYRKLDTTKSKVDWINLDHELLNDVFERNPGRLDLPSVQKSFPVELSASPGVSEVLRYRNDLPFLSLVPVSKGNMLLSAVPLDATFSNYPTHSLMVYLTINMALQSGGLLSLDHTVGNQEPVSLGNLEVSSDQTLRLQAAAGSEEIIPEMLRRSDEYFIKLHRNLNEAGNYNVLLEGSTKAALAFNYSRDESRLRFPGTDEIRNWVDGLTGIEKSFLLADEGLPFEASLRKLGDEDSLSWWFIVAALGFLLFEVLILRFIK